MRQIKRFLALIYILSIFMGVAHEITHVHQLGDSCQVCTISHTPALATDAPVLACIDAPQESFDRVYTNNIKPLTIPSQSRSPPLA